MGIKMPSASKFVAKHISLRRPQYIGFRSKTYDPRGIPVRIWVWDDDDGIHVKVEADSFGAIVFNEHTKTLHSEVNLRIFNEPVTIEERVAADLVSHIVDPNRIRDR